MHTSIQPTAHLDAQTQQQIMLAAPEKWLGIKQDLTNTLTQDMWVQFAQENNSAYLSDVAGKIVSYCAFGNQWTFFEEFTKNIKHPYQNPAVLIYLFTRTDEQNKGYARQLFEDVVTTCRATGHDALLFSTWSHHLQEMYQRWWCSPCKVIHPTNSFFVKEGITKDAVFGVQLVGK